MSTTRASRASMSTVLIVGLLIGVSVAALKPGIRQSVRDPRTEGLTSRQLTATLARAVRQLVGSDIHRPAIRSPFQLETEASVASTCPASQVKDNGIPLLRDSLLSLPPPLA